MSRKLRRNLIMVLAFICLIVASLPFVSWQVDFAQATTPTPVIATLDNPAIMENVTSRWAARTTVSYSEGYLNVNSTYTDDGKGNVSNPANDTDGDGFGFNLQSSAFDGSLEDMKYLQIKLCRENCSSARIQVYLFKNETERCAITIDGASIDSKWTIMTIDLTNPTADQAISFYDVETGQTSYIKAYGASGDLFNGTLSYIYFNLGKQNLANKKAKVEYVGFFATLEQANAYKGDADNRLARAESVLTDPNTILSTEFKNANSEQKAIEGVTKVIAQMAGVGSEITEYKYTPAKVGEKGMITFNVKLWSAGKSKILENLVMYIGEKPQPTILTFDNNSIMKHVESTWTKRTTVSYSQGFLNVVSTYTDDGKGNVSNPGADKENDGDGFAFRVYKTATTNSVENMRYLQIKLYRENCSSSKIQAFVYNDTNRYAFTIENLDIDEKWTTITLDLLDPTSSSAVMVYDVDSKTTSYMPATSPNGTIFNGEFTYLQFNLGREFLANKTAKVEYVALFSTLEEAQEYTGEADDRLDNAEEVLLNAQKDLIFGNANTEEKAINQVSEKIASLTGVGSEVIDYVYTPSEVGVKGSVNCSVKLWSAGKYRELDNLIFYIDEVPAEPIMLRFNNQETIDLVEPAWETSMELVDGVMMMTKISPRVEDGFFFTFSTPGAVEPFLMQNYSFIKIKLKQMSISGKMQIYYPKNGVYSDDRGNNYSRTYVSTFETDQWVTIILDMSKSENAVEVCNLETGEITYNHVYDGHWETGFTPTAFEGLSEFFRFTFGRKDNLERVSYIEYVAFFPTIEMAREYDEDGEKFKADTAQKIKDYDFVAQYGDATTKEDAENFVLASISNLVDGNIDINVETTAFKKPKANENGDYKFIVSIENKDLGVSFTMPEIDMPIRSISNSVVKVWKYNNESFTSQNVGVGGSTVSFDGEVMKIAGVNKVGGYTYSAPFEAGFNMAGNSFVKLRYKADANFECSLKFESGYSFSKYQISSLTGGGGYKEVILSLADNKLYVNDNGWNELSTVAVPSGLLKGITDKFTLTFNGTDNLYIEYVAFASSLDLAKGFDGTLGHQQILDNITDITLNAYATNARTENDAKEFVKKRVERPDATVQSIEFISYNFTDKDGGELIFNVTYRVGDLSAYTLKTVSGKLNIGKGIDVFSGKYDYVNYIEIDGEYYLESAQTLLNVPNKFSAHVLIENLNPQTSLIVGNQNVYLFVDEHGELALYLNGQTISSNADIIRNEWTQVSVEFTSSKVKFFVNGQLVNEETVNNTLTDSQMKQKIFVGGFGVNNRNIFGSVKFVEVCSNEQILESWKLGESAHNGTYVNTVNAQNYMELKNTYGHLYHEFLGSDYIYLNNDLADIPNTFEAWLRLSSAQSGNEQVIISNGSIKISVLANGNVKAVFGGATYESESVNMFNDSWTHIAVVRDTVNGTVNLYVNGQAKIFTLKSGNLSTVENDLDKNVFAFGAEMLDYENRTTPNDIIIYLEPNQQPSVLFSNDTMIITLLSNYQLKLDFYNGNTYTYTKSLEGGNKYIRLYNDKVDYALDLYISSTLAGVYDRENLVDAKGVGESVEHTWVWKTSKSIFFDSRVESTSLVGYMGEVRMWSTVRTEQEILQNMLAFYSGDKTNLVGQWKFDYSDSLVYEDISGASNGAKIFAAGFFKTNIDESKYKNAIVVLPDTQNYVTKDSTNQTLGDPENNDVIAEWIVDNVNSKNIIAATHCGDITQNATPLEFEWVYSSYSILDGVLPYLFTLGNHDLPSLGGTGAEIRDASNFNRFWNYDYYAELNKMYNGFGVFEEGHMENAYIIFDDGVNEFILFVVELSPRDEVLEWVDIMAKKHSDKNAILVTHAFMGIDTVLTGENGAEKSDAFWYSLANSSSVNEGVDIVEKVIKRNDNFIAVFCGHRGASDLAFQMRTITTNGGTEVKVVLVDTSAAEKHFPSNSGVIGIMEYNDNGEVVSYMYSPKNDAFFNTDNYYEYEWELK